MGPATIALAVIATLLVAVCAVLALERKRLVSDGRTLREQLDAEERAANEIRLESARLTERLDAADRARAEEAGRVEALHKRFQDTFDALAAKALDASQRRLLELAKENFGKEQEKARGELEQRKQSIEQLVKPISETLTRLEKERVESHGALMQHTRAVAQAGEALRAETSKLTQALRRPEVRGRYGEIQLQRVAELAGMRDYCDFAEQTSSRDSDGRLLRPDMVVHLPNDRVIVVDAKCNIEPYLNALDCDDQEAREACLDNFATGVLKQARALAGKSYWSQYDGSPEFVVMFVPGDQFVDAALQREPSLLDAAAEHGVIIASPSTLIGLLRAVHVGWREKKLSDDARELFRLGSELHERAAVVLDHAHKVGRAIETARNRYNDFVGSVDTRLMPTLRRFEESGANSSRELSNVTPIDGETRELRSLPEPTPDDAPKSDAPSLPINITARDPSHRPTG